MASSKVAPLKARHIGLLAIPYIALLCPLLYFRETPTLLGLPFFFWYQFAWILLSSALTGIVYLGIRR